MSKTSQTQSAEERKYLTRAEECKKAEDTAGMVQAYLEASEKFNSAEAQYQLGEYYSSNDDNALANRYYHLAAEQGHSLA